MHRKIYLLIFCLSLIFTLTSCGKSNTIDLDKPYTKYVDIYDVVKESFLTDDGYTSEISKHMTQEIFNRTNYKSYRVTAPEYKKPFKIKLDLKEVSQSPIDDLVYVDMNYSIEIKDADDKNIGGTLHNYIQFTVKLVGKEWYIINKYEKP